MGLLDTIFRRNDNNATNKQTVDQANKVENQRWSNDFLKRGSIQSRKTIEIDQKNDPTDLLRGYLWAALNYRADNFTDFCIENIITDTEAEGREHPYLLVIRNSISQPEAEFWRDIITQYDYTGEVFLFVLRRVVSHINENKQRVVEHIGLPTRIEVIPTNDMKVLKNSLGEIVGYEHILDKNHKREFAPEQIIHIVNKNPADKNKPYSIFEAAREYQYTINKGTDFAQSAMVNALNTPGIMSTEEVLSDEEYDNFVSRVNQHEAGKIIVTDGSKNLKYTTISQDINKAAFPDITELSRQTIFAITGTSKTVLGIEESGTTRETARVQDKKFVKRAIAPLAKRILAALNFDYRVRYHEQYKNNEISMVIKPVYDAVEVKEQIETQKLAYDTISSIIEQGFTKESAEEYVYGDINYTDLEEDDSILDKGIPNSDEKKKEDSASMYKISSILKSYRGGTITLDDAIMLLSKIGISKEEALKILNEPNEGVEDEDSDEDMNKVELENQLTDEHNHTHSDNYYDKLFVKHMDVQTNEYDEYAKLKKVQLDSAKNELLKNIRKIQLDAIKDSSNKIRRNSFDYDDIRTEEEKDSIFVRLFNAFKKYWFLVLPVISSLQSELTKEKYNLDGNVNLLGEKSVNDFIKEISENAARSHTDTIYNDILKSANKAYEKVAKDLFAKKYVENYDQANDRWFKTKPTEANVKSKLSNEKFVNDNEKLYKEVQDLIDKGYNRTEIQKAIKNKYVDLSRKRANTIVGNEMAKSINQGQYLTDLQLLKENNLLDKAYKQLYSTTGNPCPICKEIINKGPIPFEENFVNKGESVTTTNENGETVTMNFDYEDVESGVCHCNCHCQYELIIKN